MGAGVLVLGRSGAGKSASLRNFKPGEVGVFNCAFKPMPFRCGLEVIDTQDYRQIIAAIRRGNRRAYIVDDAGYLMQDENIDRRAEKGFDKYGDMAGKFVELIRAIGAAPRDVIVYVLMHPDLDALGREKPMTVGKFLDEKYCIQGRFTVVLDCDVVDGEHVFTTENDGQKLAKAPMGCFDRVIPNDLKFVDTTLREYWGLKPIVDEAPEGGGSK